MIQLIKLLLRFICVTRFSKIFFYINLINKFSLSKAKIINSSKLSWLFLFIFTFANFDFSFAAEKRNLKTKRQGQFIDKNKDSANRQDDKSNIDLESLGLDPIDDVEDYKDESSAISNEIETENVSNQDKTNQDKTNSEEDLSNNNIQSKIQNFVKTEKVKQDNLAENSKQKEAKEATKTEVQKKESTKIEVTKTDRAKTEINKKSSLKQSKKFLRENLRKRIVEERKRNYLKIEEKKRVEKKNRLNELRKKYLTEMQKEVAEKAQYNIVPREKDLGWSSRFISYELPAQPILDRNRSIENVHIPIIPTVKERVDRLFEAIKSGDVAYFNNAYKDVLDPDVVSDFGETLLTYSALLQRRDIISSILTKGADPDLPNRLGHTAFDIAIEMLDLKTATILKDNNADLNYKDGLGRTYLMHASRVGFLPIVDLLISSGVNINESDDEGITALAIAYRHKKDIIAKFLLKSGAKTWTEKPYNPEKHSLIDELNNRIQKDKPSKNNN